MKTKAGMKVAEIQYGTVMTVGRDEVNPMSTLTIELPPDIGLSEQDAKRLFVAKLYEDGIVTPGRGAEMLGMTYREFIETFGMYCRMTPEDLDEEMRILNQVVDTESVQRRMAAKANNHG